MMRLRCALIAAVISLIGAACASDADTPEQARPAETSSPAAEPSPSASVEDLSKWAPPEFKEGALTAWSKEKTVRVWAEPDDSAPHEKTIKTTNPAGQRILMLVLEALRDEEGTSWAKVLLSERPNGSTGWVHLEPMVLTLVKHRIEVDLSDYELKHYVNNRLVGKYEVGTGTPANPTPTGQFYVWAAGPPPDTSGPYGAHVLGLSGFSPNLSDWPGGGRSAIHGTSNPGDRGSRVSHGCVRVYNEDMTKLAKVPMGTPVLIQE